MVTSVYPDTSEIFNVMIDHSAWTKGPLPPNVYAAKGACLLLPGFSELAIASEKSKVTRGEGW